MPAHVVPSDTHDRLWMHELMRREMETRSRTHTLFPLMRHDQPDTHERTRLAMQSIPWALPPKKDNADGP